MIKHTTNPPAVTIGLDLGDRRSQVEVIDRQGEWLASTTVRTTRTGIRRALDDYGGARVVLEVGTHSPWVSRMLAEDGFEVVVANPRRVRLIAAAHHKSDKVDAELLARLGRADRELLAPVTHRSQQTQADLVLLRTRDGLVEARTKLINMARGQAKSLGLRLPACSAPAFHKRAAQWVNDSSMPGIGVTLAMIEQLTTSIRDLDRRIEVVAAARYPETRVLTQVRGVGTLTALCFILTIEDPKRFASSREVGPYLGLVPKQRQSGDREPALGITKHGDAMLRRLLVGSARYILGPFGPDCDLRRFGTKLSASGGLAARNRAAVAVARKLAVLMHHLWISGEVYEPVGYGSSTRRLAEGLLCASVAGDAQEAVPVDSRCAD